VAVIGPEAFRVQGFNIHLYTYLSVLQALCVDLRLTNTLFWTA
jgi:hypothetical protein